MLATEIFPPCGKISKNCQSFREKLEKAYFTQIYLSLYIFRLSRRFLLGYIMCLIKREPKFMNIKYSNYCYRSHPIQSNSSQEHIDLCISGIGFTPNLITMLMEDIDECTELPGSCVGGNCKNTFGGYTCECPAGYELDASDHKCIDVDECSEENNPCGTGECHNKAGSHHCTCTEGNAF